jgi:hypothetical protein
VDLDIVLLDNDSRSHLSHQIVLAHNLTFGRGKHTQNVERPATKLYRFSVSFQFALAQVKSELVKAKLIPIHQIQPSRSRIQNN